MNRSTAKKATQSPLQRTGLVWLLTAVGLSTVAIVLAASFWSLVRIRADRVASDKLLAEVSSIANRGDRVVEHFGRNSLRLLNDNTANQGLDLQQHLSYQTDSWLDASIEIDQRIAGTVDELVSFTNEIQLLNFSCHRLAIKRARIRGMRSAGIRESEAAILHLQRILSSAEGTRMLELAKDFQIYKRLDGKAAQEAAQQFLEIWSTQFIQSEVGRDLDELLLLHQQLIAETNRDALIDLRDNQIKPRFDRLRRIFESQLPETATAEVVAIDSDRYDEATTAPAADPRLDALQQLETAFLGVGFTYDRGRQSILMGRGGLYQSCAQWLEVEAERELLKSSRVEHLSRYAKVKDQLLQRSAKTTSDSAHQATALVAKASMTILVIGLLSAVVFLILAKMIAKTISSQLNTLSQQSIELKAAKAEADKLSLVAKHTSNSVVITDSASRIEWVNDGFTRITGYAPKEVIGLVPGHFLPGEDTDPRTVELIRAAMLERKGFDVELINYHKDGTPYWIATEVRPIRDSDGSVMNFIAIGSDITSRKTADRERELLASELQASARQAGMAELAGEVLHNVGNALNSINVSAQTLRDRFDSPTCEHLTKASQLICDHEDQLADFVTLDPRGKQFPNFFRQLASVATSDRQSQLDEVRELIEKIDHVKEIVACQQAFSNQRSPREPASPVTVAEQAIKMNIASLGYHGIRLERDFESGSDVLLEKHSIIQVLMNLIKNAKESVVAADMADPCIKVSIRRRPHEITFIVSDNGMGIAKENFVEVFRHGYTTKESGQGYGLHSSGNMAQDLGGSLSAASEGERRGATFTLTVPTIEITSCIA
ncbi:Sensor protein FixL [Rubripirellula lacrimiformis]|uniref:histidine kinase n=1 Tax=Rubripirellula lacrimiformis TaxID=1930273 RepID=A0A517NIJ7_9BACT|nr:sensor histidine kinase [Rubripirellula lacrimiformis]QDT06956.1 Sensor protein FixL [Rubripirellula lacrimiformis]